MVTHFDSVRTTVMGVAKHNGTLHPDAVKAMQELSLTAFDTPDGNVDISAFGKVHTVGTSLPLQSLTRNEPGWNR